jgi:hypothetical protein
MGKISKDNRFTADQFKPTKWSTSEDKARFANQFVQFCRSGFSWKKFHKTFYRQLINTFGHIAHYNQLGFYEYFFGPVKASVHDGRMFLDNCRLHIPYDDGSCTFSDVEKVLIDWIENNYGSLVFDQAAA